MVVGRKLPTDKDKEPVLYRMRIFARDHVYAKSRFWYFISKLRKIKKATGEIVAVHKLIEHHPLKIKNYGIFLRYNSRTGTHNMYKEYREFSRAAAVRRLYQEMAQRHMATERSIQIIQVAELKPSQCKRVSTRQFFNNRIKFPLPHRIYKPRNKAQQSLFTTRRPKTYKH